MILVGGDYRKMQVNGPVRQKDSGNKNNGKQEVGKETRRKEELKVKLPRFQS